MESAKEQKRPLHRIRSSRAQLNYESSPFAVLLNAPALIVILVLVGYPIVYSAWVSLHKYSLKRPRVFDYVGLTNYLTKLQT